jgi:hypothetical protein
MTQRRWVCALRVAFARRKVARSAASRFRKLSLSPMPVNAGQRAHVGVLTFIGAEARGSL